MKKILQLTLIALLVTNLSGCIAAAVGAGAAGGAYVAKHYDISIKKKK